MISIIVPVYNEETSLSRLNKELSEVLNSLKQSYEVICIDDGSSDSSFEVLKDLVDKNPNLIIVRHTRNFGQTAAIATGLKVSRGEIIVLIDADLQNSPGDIPRLLDKMAQGYDVVSGWRRYRKASWFRKVMSILGNKLIVVLTGVKLKDFGCSLKAYKRRALEDIGFYGQVHRFIPAYLGNLGYRIAEVEVGDRKRLYGSSKYNITRTFKFLIDVFTAKFFLTFLTKANYIFGGLAMLLFTTAGIFFCWTLMTDTPRGILLSGLLFIIGLQFILVGILAELLVRIFHRINGQPPYPVSSVFKRSTDAPKSQCVEYAE